MTERVLAKSISQKFVKQGESGYWRAKGASGYQDVRAHQGAALEIN